MSIAEKLLTVATNMPLVFEAGEKKHILRYKTELCCGDGASTVSFDCPFEPDVITVIAHGTDAMNSANSVRQLSFDRRAFARYGGVYLIRQNGANVNGNFSSATGKNYFRYSDGECAVEVPSSLGVPFTNGAHYICIALKYTDKGDRDLLYDEISALFGTGDVLQYSKARINATVNDTEWQTLIATKPNRTFTLY